MTDGVVHRWARYGHERLYAEAPDGSRLGYLDLKTGDYHPDDPEHLSLLEQAIRDHLAAQEPPVPSVDLNLQESIGPEWQDLSVTPPGAAARERANAERANQSRLRHVVARVLGAKTGERSWRIGADGEVATANQLAKLGPQWHVLHAIRVGQRGADIDHLVIGPAGVFTVNSKHHPHKSIWVGGETFMVDGHKVPYVRKSRHEARRAARLLTEQARFPVEVVGVVAVIGANKGFTIKKQPADGAVFVIQRNRITKRLLGLPPRLAATEVDAIYEVARRSTTWT